MLTALLSRSARLAVQFNLRHNGVPVTQQAVHKWLSGKACPTPDKIATLAAWLGVSTHWLRFGSPESATAPPCMSASERTTTRYADKPESDIDEQGLLAALRKLTPHQRRLIVELVNQLLLERQGS